MMHWPSAIGEGREMKIDMGLRNHDLAALGG